jgi:hypothetical protein
MTKLLGISTGSLTHCTKVITDFDEIFSVCKAFNSKHFDKKACQRSPFGAKMWNSHIFFSLIMLI